MTLADRYGLPEVTPTLTAGARRRRCWLLAGLVAGLAATLLLRDWSLPVRCAPVVVGYALGALTDALTRPGPPPGTLRVAHPAGTGLADYVPGWLLAGLVVVVSGPGGLALAWAAAPRPSFGIELVTGGWVALVALVPVAAFAVSLGLARLVIGRPQPAGSAAELAVSDALRAQSVRDVLLAPAALAVAAAWILVDVPLYREVGAPGHLLGGRGPLLLLAGSVLATLAYELAGGPRHWRRVRP